MENKTIILIIATIIAGIIFGSIIYIIIEPKQIKESETNNNLEIQETDSKELKVGPNTKVILNTIYQNCGHETEKILDTQKYINMKENEIKRSIEEEKKEDEIYKIEVFEDNILIISKKINEMCDRHFVVTQKDNKVIVYYEQYDSEKKLKNDKVFKTTEISTEYLTEVDKQTLEEGIIVQEEKEINRVLESYK